MANGAAGLERHARMPPGLDVNLDHGVGAPERGFDVTVAVAQDDGFGRAAGLELAGRIAGRQHGGQLLDLDGHQLGRVLSHIRVLGEHRRDRVTDIAHEGLGQCRLPEFANAFR